MKKPLFNEFDRQIIQEDKSLSAAIMKLYIAVKKFEKAFLKTAIGRFFDKI